MSRFFIVFLFFIFSCNNNISLDKNGWIKDNYLISVGDNFYLKDSKKPYILKNNLIIPKGKNLIIKNGTNIVFKKNTDIINNGGLFFGEKKTDSLNYFKESDFLKKEFIYNVELYFKKNNKLINNNNIFFNYCYINNCNIKNNKYIYIYDSFFEELEINNNYKIDLNNCYFKNSTISIKNSTISVKNSFFNNLKNIEINNSNNIIINNNVFYNNSNLIINNSESINIINNIFYKNKNSVVINNKNGYTKFYNNLFIENNIALEKLDTSMVYIINNNFDKNKIAIKSILNIKSNKNIISKNNIYSYNNSDFKLYNNNILNSYCLTNNDSLKGYYNLYGDPFYIDSKKFNYVLDSISPALRSGNNNNNLGVNINNIINIKYLK